MTTLKRYIKEHPFYFFHEMSDAHLDILSQHSGPVDIAKGEFVFHAGDDADQFHLLQVGEVAIVVNDPKKGQIVIQTLSAGEVLGFSWLMAPYTYRFDAIATEATRAMAFDAVAIRQALQQDHDFAYELTTRFLTVMSQRLHASRLQILEQFGGFSMESDG